MNAVLNIENNDDLCTSVKIRPVLCGVCGDFNRRAVPTHVTKGLLAGFFYLTGSMYYGLHELQVATAQLSLG